nr:MAG TPA: hypothetical protein [Caudoviricetes sp.]
MSVKISLYHAVIVALSASVLSAAYGRVSQKKYYKNLFKLSFTSKDPMVRKFANSIIFEDLRIQLEPSTKED